MQFTQDLSGRIEVLHYVFSDQDVSVPKFGTLDYDADLTIVRAGLDWHLH